MDITKFKVDKDKATRGVWCDIHDNLKVLLARQGNEKYETYVRRNGLERLRQMRHLSEDDRTLAMKKVVRQATARFILLDWEGLEEPNDDGTLVPVPYSIEKAETILEEYPEFYDMVLEMSSSFDRYAAEAEQVSEGN